MNLTKVSCGLTGCLFAALLSGCVVVTDSSEPDPGTIDVNITIDGDDDVFVCSDFLVDEIEVVIIGHNEFAATTDCDDLGITLDGVPPGTYDVQVTLLAGGRQVSDPGVARDVRVFSGGLVSIDVNFPASTIDPP